jgi:hypothetical protein
MVVVVAPNQFSQPSASSGLIKYKLSACLKITGTNHFLQPECRNVRELLSDRP